MVVTLEQIDEVEQELHRETTINEEYKIWKKNSPFLYDTLVTHAFDWPTLTCQWFPDVERPSNAGYSVHRLLTGTHTSDGEPNYLQIVRVELPNDDTLADEDGAAGDMDVDGRNKPTAAAARCKITITQKIPHEGEPNRARYMPQNPDLIATKAVNGQVLLFDRTKAPLMPKTADAPCKPELRLLGHTAEGYGLDWHPLKEGHLISAAGDKSICYWDIRGMSGKEQSTMEPLHVFKHHTKSVSDVAWHPMHTCMFASVGDDGQLCMWDIRDTKSSHPRSKVTDAHRGEINAVSFNPSSEFLFATGGANDCIVALWDLRNMKNSLHQLEGHREAVQQLSWSPHNPTILGSSSSDRRVHVWDISRIGEEQSAEDQEDGPPELLFMHGGHTNSVVDFSWNKNEPWTVCSVAEDNVMQIWQMASNIYLGNSANLISDMDIE
ncbi:WD40 repeat-like protein [Ramicandelaber brevisporus]|nr:WD40 repeat-like protein [Ramicandelaber brevisporus]